MLAPLQPILACLSRAILGKISLFSLSIFCFLASSHSSHKLALEIKKLNSDLNAHAYIQKEWQDYWCLYLAYIRKSTNSIFDAINKDRISKLNKQNIPIFLKFLVHIIDRSYLLFSNGDLREILERIQEIDKTAEDNEDYKLLLLYLDD